MSLTSKPATGHTSSIEVVKIEQDLDKGLLAEDSAQLALKETEDELFASRNVVRLINANTNLTKDEREALQEHWAIAKVQKHYAIRDYKEVLVSSFKSKKSLNTLRLLISSKSIYEFIKRFKYISEIKLLSKQRVKKCLEKEKAIREKLFISGSTQQKYELTKEKTENLIMLNEKVRKQYVHLKAIQLRNNHRRLALRNAGVEKYSTNERLPIYYPNSSNFSICFPVKIGIITEGLGLHKHPTERKVLVSNSGLNILTNAGEQVLAVADGEVKQVVRTQDNQVHIVIKHGQYYSVYSSVSDVQVSSGYTVSKGEFIARVEAIGTEPQELHFELWNGSKNVNPAVYFEERR